MLSLLRAHRARVVSDHDDASSELVEDPIPIATGRHQVAAGLGAKAATVGLFTCLVFGPIGAAAGAFALLKDASPAEASISAPTDLSNERAIVGQFAQQVVVTWLTATQEDPDALLALVKDTTVAGLSKTPFVVADPTISGITFVDGVWSVTVAATVTDARDVTAYRFFQIPVSYTAGVLAALTLPTPISPAPAVRGASDGYETQVDTDSALGQTVAQFLNAYLTGSGEVSRYLTPGVAMTPLDPSPYTSIRVLEIRAAGSDSAPSDDPRDGDQIRIIGLGAAAVTEEQTASVAYALTLTARAGRWEISAIDPVPAVISSKGPTTPEISGAAPSTPTP